MSPGANKTSTETLSKNLGVMPKKKDKDKEKEVAKFEELPVIHETELNENLYRDLFGVSTDFNIGSWSSLNRQFVSNITSSHSKRTEKTAPDPETRPALGFIVEPFSSTAQNCFPPASGSPFERCKRGKGYLLRRL